MYFSNLTATVRAVEYLQPPSNPDDWNDEQWLEWLKATDDITTGGEEDSLTKVVSRIVHSTPGQILGQAMIGMSQAIYGREVDDVVIVTEDSDHSGEDDAFAVQLDFAHPEQSSVTFKPSTKK